MPCRYTAFSAVCFLVAAFLSVSHSCPIGYHGSPCTIRRCESLFTPPNGAIVGECLTEYSSVCRMQCHVGYEAVGSEERRCDVSPHNVMIWTGTPLQCIAITCPVLTVPNAVPPTGVCTSPSFLYNTRCTFTCQAGYLLTGSKERVCQLDKSWSGTTTSCVARRCESLIPPPHSVIVGPCGTELFSICRMECSEGFEAVGSVERTCVVNAFDVTEWTGLPLQCVAITCPVLTVPNADPPTGVCTSPSLLYNTHCTFTCRAGYRLKGCKKRVCQLDKSWSGTPTSCVAI